MSAYISRVVLFLILFIPSIIGSRKAQVYYNLDESLLNNLPSIIATNKYKVVSKLKNEDSDKLYKEGNTKSSDIQGLIDVLRNR